MHRESTPDLSNSDQPHMINGRRRGTPAARVLLPPSPSLSLISFQPHKKELLYSHFNEYKFALALHLWGALNASAHEWYPRQTYRVQVPK